MAESSSTVRRVGGAPFHVRVGIPLMVSSSISNIWPGAVRVAVASAREGTAASDPSAVSVMDGPLSVARRFRRARPPPEPREM